MVCVDIQWWGWDLMCTKDLRGRVLINTLDRYSINNPLTLRLTLARHINRRQLVEKRLIFDRCI